MGSIVSRIEKNNSTAECKGFLLSSISNSNACIMFFSDMSPDIIAVSSPDVSLAFTSWSSFGHFKEKSHCAMLYMTFSKQDLQDLTQKYDLSIMHSG